MTENSPRLPVARIAKAHGIKGQVKLIPYTNDPGILEVPEGVYLSEYDKTPVTVTITGRTKKHLLAAIEGITDRTAAEELRGKDLWIDKDTMPEPETGDEFYIDDLIGLKAYDEKGDYVGEVIDVANFGAGDLLDIKPESGNSFYLLFSEDTVPDINLEAKTVTVDIPEMI